MSVIVLATMSSAHSRSAAIFHLLALCTMLLFVSGSSLAFDGRKQAGEMVSSINQRTANQHYADADYIFVCSSVPGLDARSVAAFYKKEFADNKTVKIYDVIHHDKLRPGKAYLLISYGVKPLNGRHLECLRKFPNINKEWMDSVISQDKTVGTLPEYLKNINEFGKYYTPIHSMIKRMISDDGLIFFVSVITIKGGDDFLCSSLLDSFGFKSHEPRNRRKCVF